MEGRDFNTMGVVSSPSPSSKFTLSPATPTNPPTQPRLQPATPNVVPPTPSVAPSASAAPSPNPDRPPSPTGSSSSTEFYVDVADPGYQTKRRSMFRSPGTSSSPDLATLVRKAKERNGGTVPEPKTAPAHKDSLMDSRPSTSSQLSTPANGRMRQRSQTTVTPEPSGAQSTPASPSIRSRLTKGKNPSTHKLAGNAPSKSDGRSTSRSRSDTAASKGKSSVRAKTSAFLGKLIGTQRGTNSGPPTPSGSSSTFHDFPPPVPPLPTSIRVPSSSSRIDDVFSDNAATSPNLSKPLPAIRRNSRDHDEAATPTDLDSDDDESIVVINGVPSPPRRRNRSRSRSPEPEMTIKGHAKHLFTHSRKRSMSVGEIDTKTIHAPPSNFGKVVEQNKEWDAMLKDFRGELSQLDPISSSSLDLKDPSTRASQENSSPSQDSTTRPSSRSRLPQRPKLRMMASSPIRSIPPTLTIDLMSDSSGTLSADTSSPKRTATTSTTSTSDDPIIPARTSSLQITPTRTSSQSRPKISSTRFGPRPYRHGTSPVSAGPTNTADAMRLRAQHRSTASASEPSLVVPREDDAGRDPNRTVKLIPSSTSIQWSEDTSPAASQCLTQSDVNSEDFAVTKFNTTNMGVVSPKLEDAKDLATRCWTEDEEFVSKEKIAEWLGGTGSVNKQALIHYMNFLDFTNLRLDYAFRTLCAKLYLKAETQQVDRILEQFSRRYWENNPNTVYGSASVVHAITYSLLLLNTDLHVAELSQRMSRNQFIRNTLSAVQTQTRPGGTRASTPELTHDDGSSVREVPSTLSDNGSAVRIRGKRSGSVASWSSASQDVLATPSAGGSSTQVNSGPRIALDNDSINASEPRPRSLSITSVGRNFENDMEGLLKDMYNAIKSQQILQPLGHLSVPERMSTSSLSPGLAHHQLLRNRSQRGMAGDRLANLKRGSMRGIQTLFAAQTGISPYSSNSSIDGRASPSPSFAASAYENFAASSSSFLTPTLGFASNLSHTIIREAQEDDIRSVHSGDSLLSNVSITDEELALFGAPWAKEGMLSRKQYWESHGKRARSKAWLDVFVVIQKGDLNMFTFGGESGGFSGFGGFGGGEAVGGGNWLTNANSVGKVELAQSLAHVLPPPGYNRQRPYCFVLTLATGCVFFFQAGTEELVNEWVSTCNYWAARQSKEPLAGGVSNMEYGWNRALDNEEPMTGKASQDNDPSDTFSVRSGRSRLKDMPYSIRSAVSPYNDRTIIHEWKPPIPSTLPSMHDEETQLEALQKHVAALKSNLKQHNDLRLPMMQLYQPRSSNAGKALANWERKSQYLLTEIVKYETYLDSLKAAMAQRLKKRGEKALEKALVSTPTEELGGGGGGMGCATVKSKWKGHPDESTIPEGEEPPPTPIVSVSSARASTDTAIREANGNE